MNSLPHIPTFKRGTVWFKLASTSRRKRFFYHCPHLGLTVQQSFLTGQWAIYSTSECTFPTPAEAMAYAETL